MRERERVPDVYDSFVHIIRLTTVHAAGERSLEAEEKREGDFDSLLLFSLFNCRQTLIDFAKLSLSFRKRVLFKGSFFAIQDRHSVAHD